MLRGPLRPPLGHTRWAVSFASASVAAQQTVSWPYFGFRPAPGRLEGLDRLGVGGGVDKAVPQLARRAPPRSPWRRS